MKKVNKLVRLIVVMMMVGVGFSKVDVYAEKDVNKERTIYTEKVFEDLNKDLGLKESEDFEYVYEGDRLVGIEYFGGELEFSISLGVFLVEEEETSEYEEVYQKINKEMEVRRGRERGKEEEGNKEGDNKEENKEGGNEEGEYKEGVNKEGVNKEGEYKEEYLIRGLVLAVMVAVIAVVIKSKKKIK